MLRISIYVFAWALLCGGCGTSPRNGYKNMVWIKGGQYMMGSADKEGKPDEYPLHKVKVSGFWMDATEVTNAEFMEFVMATGYITTAERSGSDASDEPSGAYVFSGTSQPVPLSDVSAWWRWTEGADWVHPEGPQSSIAGKEKYPVVNVSWEDASAYARWAGKQLPTEAQWEFAARGGLVNQPYEWGDEPLEAGKPKINTWQGSFPCYNSNWDGFKGLAPVRSFAANGYGLYDMTGNVWEWCKDNYVANDDRSGAPQKVLRGGSFLCNASFCKGYRVSSRMRAPANARAENAGFRCVAY